MCSFGDMEEELQTELYRHIMLVCGQVMNKRGNLVFEEDEEL